MMTTVPIAGTLANSTALGAAVVITLILLLVVKQLVATRKDSRSRRFAAVLNVGIMPLMFAFAALLVARVLAAL